MKTNNNFPALIEAFFTDRLMRQRQASPNTIASYRDSFCLLFNFAKQRLKKEPSALSIEDLDAAFIGSFLNHIEKDRGNCARSRNVRLAAIHSFFKYIALQDPIHSALIQRVLAIPTKKYERKPIDFLTKPEIEALLAAPDQSTWGGRRDSTLLSLAIQTGLRVSELIGLTCKDVVLGSGANVRCKGKGRKERCTPLRKELVTTLRSWLRERSGQPDDPLFPNARGGFLSRDGVEYLLAKHVAVAGKQCPSIEKFTEAEFWNVYFWGYNNWVEATPFEFGFDADSEFDLCYPAGDMNIVTEWTGKGAIIRIEDTNDNNKNELDVIWNRMKNEILDMFRGCDIELLI